MKVKILLSLLALIFCNNIQANASNSDQFFTAYQVSQVSGLSKLIRQYAKTPSSIDAIAKAYLSKQSNQDLIKQYNQDNEFKKHIQTAIARYLNSDEASQLYDSLATNALANSYSYEELKTLYQFYDNSDIQKFITNQNSFELEQLVQSYQSKVVFQSKLDTGTQALLDSVKVENEAPTQNSLSQNNTDINIQNSEVKAQTQQDVKATSDSIKDAGSKDNSIESPNEPSIKEVPEQTLIINEVKKIEPVKEVTESSSLATDKKE